MAALAEARALATADGRTAASLDVLLGLLRAGGAAARLLGEHGIGAARSRLSPPRCIVRPISNWPGSKAKPRASPRGLAPARHRPSTSPGGSAPRRLRHGCLAADRSRSRQGESPCPACPHRSGRTGRAPLGQALGAGEELERGIGIDAHAGALPSTREPSKAADPMPASAGRAFTQQPRN